MKKTQLDKIDEQVSALENEQRGSVIGPDGHEPTIVRVREMVRERGLSLAKEKGRRVTGRQAGISLLMKGKAKDHDEED